MLLPKEFVVGIESLDLEDKSIVGQELSSLGQFSKHGGLILPRIIVTPSAFKRFLEENALTTHIKHLLGSVNHEHHTSLFQTSSYIQKSILNAKMPQDITKPLFKKLEKLNKSNLEAYYFQGTTPIGFRKITDIKGESVIADSIRELWANLFTPQNLKRYTITHNNHHEFSVCIGIEGALEFELSGYVKTFGKNKGEYEIEARSNVRFTYHKHSKTITKGHILPGGDKNALSVADLKALLEIAKISEKAFYLPQELYWGKMDGKYYVTGISPSTSIVNHDNTYGFLAKSITINPGITIGRLNVINERTKASSVTHEEIVLLKSVDRDIISAVKKAKGIIVEADPTDEIVQMLKSVGIPTVVRKHERLLYSTGDIVSLNATTGEVKRGSILVS